MREKLYNIGVNGNDAVAHTKEYKDGSIKNGWLIHDVFIPEKALFQMPSLNVSPEKAGKLFRTRNIVAQNRTYTINLAGLPGLYQRAIRTGFRRYNNLNLTIDFRERNNNSANIDIRLTANTNQAEFPTNNRPGSEIQLERGLRSADAITEIFMHELGHSVGLRHSDWSTRSSCGPRDPESRGPEGAIHIPGTDRSGNSTNSIMLACGLIGPNFTNQDRRALRAIY